MTKSPQKFKTYLFSYNYEGAKWAFDIMAPNEEDAKKRLARIAFAQFDGELMMTIPVQENRFFSWALRILGINNQSKAP